MTYFVVRHKQTGNILPNRAGSTFWDPQLAEPGLPRLFKSKAAARIWIQTWAKGTVRKVMDSEWNFGSPYEYVARLEYDPVDGRSRDLMEIVPTTLVYGEPL